MITYRIKEDNEDPLLKVIEKTGQSYTFTLADVTAAKKYNDKQEREIRGQLEIEKAKMVNIENNHPEVAQMEGVKLVAAKIYQESKEYVEKAEKKLQEFAEAKGNMMTDLMDLYSQIPELAEVEKQETEPQANETKEEQE